HRIHARRALSIGQEQAIPGWRALLLVAPEEDIGSEALARIGGDMALVSLLQPGRLRRGIAFDGSTPGRLRALPVSGRSPLGDDVGAGPPALREFVLQLHDVAVQL